MLVFTRSYRSRILRHLVGGAALPKVGPLYLGLSLAKAHRWGDHVEPSAPCYARARIGDPSGMFGVPYVDEVANIHPVTFATPTAEWGRIRSVFLADGPGAGALIIATGDLDHPSDLAIGSIPTLDRRSVRLAPFADPAEVAVPDLGPSPLGPYVDALMSKYRGILGEF